jgi:RecJ-like exonuclease
MGAYPPGTTQAMHDRAFASDDREDCQTCDGTGYLCAGGECDDCHGTGYDLVDIEGGDDAYDQAREDEDVEF